MRKFRETVGAVLATIGFLLLVGSFAVWQIGPETMTEMIRAFYERSRPVLPFAAAGLVLLVLGGLLSSGGRRPSSTGSAGRSPVPSTDPLVLEDDQPADPVSAPTRPAPSAVPEPAAESVARLRPVLKPAGKCPFCNELVRAEVIESTNSLRRDKCRCPRCGETLYVCRMPGCDNYARSGLVWDDELCPTCSSRYLGK
jgi:hypothetical protein